MSLLVGILSMLNRMEGSGRNLDCRQDEESESEELHLADRSAQDCWLFVT